MTKLCSQCHQPMPEMRAGVRLSPLKARIFDAIKRANSNGITIEDINAICFDGRASAVNIRTHIHQINDALAGTDFENSRRRTGNGWLLPHRQAALECRAMTDAQTTYDRATSVTFNGTGTGGTA